MTPYWRTLRSPLRYPGGKYRAARRIVPKIPEDFSEYREPMVGGGSVFLHCLEKFPGRNYWINDINFELYSFWKTAKERNGELVEAISKAKTDSGNGKELFSKLSKKSPSDELERAVRFFILNRTSFSGTTEAGGFSKKAFEERFTNSSISRVRSLEKPLQDVKITNSDYSHLLSEGGKDVFIFLDPPYLSRTKSKLYGKRGILHTDFDHKKLAELLKGCRHKWLATYDNSIEIKELFSFGKIEEWSLQYGMNNAWKGNAPLGSELFIFNF